MHLLLMFGVAKEGWGLFVLVVFGACPPGCNEAVDVLVMQQSMYPSSECISVERTWEVFKIRSQPMVLSSRMGKFDN